MSSVYPVPISAGLDTWKYRAFEERLYDANLELFYFAAWTGDVKVEEESLLF